MREPYARTVRGARQTKAGTPDPPTQTSREWWEARRARIRALGRHHRAELVRRGLGHLVGPATPGRYKVCPRCGRHGGLRTLRGAFCSLDCETAPAVAEPAEDGGDE